MDLNRLNEYAGILKMLRIERHFTDNYISGFVRDKSNTLLIMQQFHDFYCEGFSIIRLSDIVGFRSGEYERFFEKILESEKLLEQVEYKDRIPINNLKESLAFFDKRSENIILECESYEDAEDDVFYIGKISKMGKADIRFSCFDATGEWEKDEIAIKIMDITRIQFNTPYIKYFSKYLNE